MCRSGLYTYHRIWFAKNKYFRGKKKILLGICQAWLWNHLVIDWLFMRTVCPGNPTLYWLVQYWEKILKILFSEFQKVSLRDSRRLLLARNYTLNLLFFQGSGIAPLFYKIQIYKFRWTNMLEDWISMN